MVINGQHDSREKLKFEEKVLTNSLYGTKSRLWFWCWKRIVGISYYHNNIVFHMLCCVRIDIVDVDC